MQTVKKVNVDFELKNIIDAAGLSLAQLAKELSVPRPNISLMIHGKYENPELREKIISYCQKKLSEKPYFQTEGQRRILAVIDATLKDREFSLIVGPSGVGKTYTVKQFIEKSDAKIVYFKASKLMSAGEILRQLCEIFELPSYGSNGAKLKRIKEKAKDIDMLVVDEADLLVEQERVKYFIRKIEIFREIAEVTAVLLVGLPELDDAIYEATKSYVYSRLGYYARLQEPTAEELWEFARIRGISSKEIVSAALGRGFFRFIDKVARKAREIGEEFAVALMYMGRRG